MIGFPSPKKGVQSGIRHEKSDSLQSPSEGESKNVLKNYLTPREITANVWTLALYGNASRVYVA